MTKQTIEEKIRNQLFPGYFEVAEGFREVADRDVKFIMDLIQSEKEQALKEQRELLEKVIQAWKDTDRVNIAVLPREECELLIKFGRVFNNYLKTITPPNQKGK